MINKILQITNKETGLWLNDLDVTIDGLNLIVTGTMYLRGKRYDNVSEIFQVPVLDHDVFYTLMIEEDGTIKLHTLSTAPSLVYAVILDFEVLAGTHDLNNVTIRKFEQI